MKKIVLFVFTLFISMQCFAKQKSYIPENQENFEFTKVNRQICYQFVNDKIYFIFDGDVFNIKSPKRVFIEGTFNGWMRHNANWELENVVKNIWTIEMSVEDVKVPGKLGFPEFRFYVSAEVPYIETLCGMQLERTKIEKMEVEPNNKYQGFAYEKKSLVIYPGIDSAEVQKKIEVLKKNKKLKDYNLENQNEIEALTNFRKAAATSNLFRGSHPYKISTDFNTEQERLRLVNKQIKDNQIKGVVTLSGNEQLISGKEQISVYMHDIQLNGNQLFANLTEKTTAYEMSSIAFGKTIASIIKFVNEKDGPYYIHCRLGDEKTGTICAVISAICGATWEQVSADYEKSNEMYVNQYSDSLLLKYGFEKMLGYSLDEVENLQKAVTDYFVSSQFISRKEIETFRSKI